MKMVLIISYYFPPDPEIGGLRMHGLVKHLPEFGWEPIILTKTNHNRHETPFRVIQTSHTDYDILASIKKQIGLDPKVAVKKHIGLTNKKNKKSLIDWISNSLLEIFAYPDIQKSWCTHAINIGNEILKHEKIDALISSSTPVTSHIIANKFKNDFEVPWIADLRDLWTQNHYCEYSIIRKLIEKRLEIKTLRDADALTTVSENLIQTLKEIHTCGQMHTITNGFNPQEMNENQNLTEKFTITYTGSFYQGKRDPSTLFIAMQNLISTGKIDSKDIAVRLYGPKEDWIASEIEKYGLQDVVFEYEIIPRNISLEKQRESQLLLLFLWDHPEEIGVFTGKIFEYLAAQRPILAIGGPMGVVKDLLDETNAGMYATSIDDIKKILINCYDEYKLNGNVSYKGKEEKIYNYSQKEMARKFSMVLNNITKKNS